MPTYEYECEKCGCHFEEFQKMTDPPLKVCTKCGGRLKRLIGTGAGFLFKGKGFYTTDYRSKEYKERARNDKGGESKGTEPKPKEAKKPPKTTKT
jgi:putative FmdB family regulatory protein